MVVELRTLLKTEIYRTFWTILRVEKDNLLLNIKHKCQNKVRSLGFTLTCMLHVWYFRFSPTHAPSGLNRRNNQMDKKINKDILSIINWHSTRLITNVDRLAAVSMELNILSYRVLVRFWGKRKRQRKQSAVILLSSYTCNLHIVGMAAYFRIFFLFMNHQKNTTIRKTPPAANPPRNSE